MIHPMDLRGRCILVTGASSGIGREIAVVLSRLGADVVLTARNENRLKETFHALEPGNHSWEPFDLSEPEGIEALFEKICRNERKLHGLVHAAGISVTTPMQYIKLSDVKSIMSVNFFSFVELVKQFSKRKYHEEGSSIVAVSSISSQVGARGLTAYCASKGALESAIRAMALDLTPKKIRINAVSPGVIATPIYDGLVEIVNSKDFEADLKKRQILGVGKPEDVANAAAFLLSDASRFITGTALVVDGGYMAH